MAFSLQDIYECFTNPGRIQAYTRAPAKAEPRPGGQLSLFDGTVQGKFEELEPAKRLVLQWRFRWGPRSVCTCPDLAAFHRRKDSESPAGAIALAGCQAGSYSNCNLPVSGQPLDVPAALSLPHLVLQELAQGCLVQGTLSAFIEQSRGVGALHCELGCQLCWASMCRSASRWRSPVQATPSCI